jgi:hypothetical protein
MERLYLPLRSSVEFFEDPAGVASATRVKESAVLFEQLIFDDGQLIATVGDSMNLEILRPRHELSEADLSDPQPPAGPGEEVVLSIGTESTPGERAKRMQTVQQTVVQRTYAVQWHSVAIDKLMELNVAWAALATPSDNTLARLAGPIAQAKAEFIERAEDSAFSPQQIDFAAKSLARDGVLAATFGASINVSPMFVPMIRRTHGMPLVTGADALAIVAPNLQQLSWESIAEYRELPGSVEARGLLREFEEKARAQEPADAADYLSKVGASITEALFAALADTRVNLPKAIGREAASLAVGFVPVVGWAIGPAAGIAAALGERAEQRADGLLALASLRRLA